MRCFWAAFSHPCGPTSRDLNTSRDPVRARVAYLQVKRFRSRSVALSLIAAIVAVLPAFAHAQQQSAARSSLFNGSALAKANARKASTARGTGGSSFSSSSGGDLTQLDSVADILADDRGPSNVLGQYRGLFYLAYVRDLVGLPPVESEDSSKMAERAAMYQVAETVAKNVVGTTLEPIYREVVRNMRWFNEYTSVRVVESGSGRMGISNPKSKAVPLMELKLHVSANNLIEPRIKVGKNVVLRYDLFREAGMIELNRDF